MPDLLFTTIKAIGICTETKLSHFITAVNMTLEEIYFIENVILHKVCQSRKQRFELNPKLLSFSKLNVVLLPKSNKRKMGGNTNKNKHFGKNTSQEN